MQMQCALYRNSISHCKSYWGGVLSLAPQQQHSPHRVSVFIWVIDIIVRFLLCARSVQHWCEMGMSHNDNRLTQIKTDSEILSHYKKHFTTISHIIPYLPVSHLRCCLLLLTHILFSMPSYWFTIGRSTQSPSLQCWFLQWSLQPLSLSGSGYLLSCTFLLFLDSSRAHAGQI